MDNLSIRQALDIWSDLEQAYHGTHGFGSDTAEIYIYRLMPFCPIAAINLTQPEVMQGLANEYYARANVSLYNILYHFSDRREADIEVEGRALGEWIRTGGFTHRVHVRVMPRKP